MATLYNPLTRAGQIRTLKLLRNHLGGVDAILQIVDLNADPVYACLSYTWGGPRWEDEDKRWTVPCQSICINGIRLNIGLNLRNALDHLYDVLGGRAIWVDAICINQGDIPERNAQVALMGRIYRQAQEVVVWLGEAKRTWEVAIRNMERFNISVEEYDGQVTQIIKDALVDSELTNEDHIGIIHFLTGNRWFSRMWTLQEYILAKHIRFLCGHVSTTLETMWKGGVITNMAGLTTAWADLEVRREEWIKEFVVLVVVRHRCGQDLNNSLGTNAHGYRSREAMDPKDKIFGVLGISRTTDKWIKEPFVVDYGLSVQDIYTNAAMFGLVAWKGLEALCHVGDRTENKIPNLPSWVPDFTQALPWKTFQSTGEDMRFKAASGLQTELWLDCVKQKAVVFNASLIDCVERTCNAYWIDTNGKGLAEFLKLFFCPSGPARTYDEDAASTMLRLMVADGFKNDGIDPRRNLTELFERWLFSALFVCDEAHYKKAESALAFWQNPETQISVMAEALGIQSKLLRELVGPITRGAKQCTNVGDIELSAKGRIREIGPFAKYTQSTRHELKVQWDFAGKNRCFFRTVQGYLGLGPRTIQAGDQVMLLHGAHVPYIFRHLPKDPEAVFDFVGEAYLHGFMYGELLATNELRWGKITVY